MGPIIVKLAWWAFNAAHKICAEPHRIEHGVGSVAKHLWEGLR